MDSRTKNEDVVIFQGFSNNTLDFFLSVSFEVWSVRGGRFLGSLMARGVTYNISNFADQVIKVQVFELFQCSM